MQVRMILSGAVAIAYAAVLACSCDKEEKWDGDTCSCSYFDRKAQQEVRDERYSLRAEQAEALAEGERIALTSCADLAAWLADDEWTNVSCK